MKIGIVCYASLGGSGIVATELARHLVRRGHEVHVLSTDIPFRLRADPGGVVLHAVGTPDYPLFHEPQYVISLATRIVQVARERQLDVIHAHYAVPHATAGFLAREILRTECGGRGPRRHHDPSRHGHHPCRHQPVLRGNGQVLHRSLGRRDGGLGKPAQGHDRHACGRSRRSA